MRKVTTHKFAFTPEAEKRLQAIMDRCGTNDTALIIRNALRLYEWAVEEVEDGKEICALDENGKGECINIHPAGVTR